MVQGMTLGILLMLAAQVIMPLNDAMAKYLVAVLPALQVAWARFFFNAVLLVPLVVWRHGAGALRTSRPVVQLLRGVVLVVANLCFLFGVRHVPLADALALVFVTPLVVAALSAWLLGERVGPLQWGAILVGFAGALVIIRPGFSSLPPAAMLPLGAGVLYGVYLTLSRLLAASAAPEVTLAVTAMTGAAMLSLVAPFAWSWPTAWQWLLMVVVGAASGLGHMCITTAHIHAPASTLAPLTYLAIVTATIVGYLAFGDLPDWLTWLGMAIVVASGIFIWWCRKREA